MKAFALFLVIAACGGEPATSKSTTPTPPAGSDAGSAAGIACGGKTCTPDQTCVATLIGPGTPPPDGQPHTSTDYACEATARANSGGDSCGEVKDHRQSCIALIPAAPPQR